MEKRVVRVKIPTSRAGTWNDGNDGYTLIELSIIIILIGIIFLFALPRLDNIGDVGLRATARELAGTIQSLFDESILRKEPYRMVFNISERSYYIVGQEMDEEASGWIDVTKRRVNLPERIFIKDIVTQQDGRVTEGGVTIRFYPDGYVERNVIHISNGKRDYTMVTTPLTGKVKILEGYVEISEEE